MPTINGKVCVANGRNLLTGTSSDLKTMQLTNAWNVGPQATNGDFKIKVVKGHTYAYRTWLDNTNGPGNAFVNIRLLTTTEDAKNFSLADGTPIDKGETGYSTAVFTPQEDGYLKLTPFAYGTQATALVGWKEEKFEKGSIATDWSPAPVDKVFSNGKQVYGRNLISGSYDSSFIFGNNRDATIEKVTMDSGEVALHVIGINSTSGFYISFNFPSGIYTLSVEVKGTGTVSRLGWEGIYDDGMTPTSEWQRVSRTTSLDGKSHAFILYGAMDVYVRFLKVEEGTIATPWTPAPEDVM